MTLQWDKFTQELKETLPDDCSILYDVFRENVDQQQTINDIVGGIGTSSYRTWMQTFKPTQSQLTGVGIWALGDVGSPGPLKAQICTLSNNAPSTVLDEYTFTSWRNGVEELANFNISLNTSTYYCFVLSTNLISNDNYYRFGITNTNRYSNGKARYKNSNNTWTDYTGDFRFKTYYPINIMTNKSAPIDLSGVNYTDIKIRGKLSTNNLAYTPKIDNIKIIKEDVSYVS